MTNDKKGSAGGKATAIIQKDQARKRIDEYNNNPNFCLCCNKPILAPYDKKLYNTKIKRFCSRNCSAKYNNINKVNNPIGYNGSISIIDYLSDDEIVNAFYTSNSITEFSKKLGYKGKIKKDNLSVIRKLEKLNLNLDDLKETRQEINSISKGELFVKCSSWQNARSLIQKEARKNISII